LSILGGKNVTLYLHGRVSLSLYFSILPLYNSIYLSFSISLSLSLLTPWNVDIEGKIERYRGIGGDRDRERERGGLR